MLSEQEAFTQKLTASLTCASRSVGREVMIANRGSLSVIEGVPYTLSSCRSRGTRASEARRGNAGLSQIHWFAHNDTHRIRVPPHHSDMLLLRPESRESHPQVVLTRPPSTEVPYPPNICPYACPSRRDDIFRYTRVLQQKGVRFFPSHSSGVNNKYDKYTRRAKGGRRL